MRQSLEDKMHRRSYLAISIGIFRDLRDTVVVCGSSRVRDASSPLGRNPMHLWLAGDGSLLLRRWQEHFLTALLLLQVIHSTCISHRSVSLRKVNLVHPEKSNRPIIPIHYPRSVYSKPRRAEVQGEATDCSIMHQTCYKSDLPLSIVHAYLRITMKDLRRKACILNIT